MPAPGAPVSPLFPPGPTPPMASSEAAAGRARGCRPPEQWSGRSRRIGAGEGDYREWPGSPRGRQEARSGFLPLCSPEIPVGGRVRGFDIEFRPGHSFPGSSRDAGAQGRRGGQRSPAGTALPGRLREGSGRRGFPCPALLPLRRDSARSRGHGARSLRCALRGASTPSSLARGGSAWSGPLLSARSIVIPGYRGLGERARERPRRGAARRCGRPPDPRPSPPPGSLLPGAARCGPAVLKDSGGPPARGGQPWPSPVRRPLARLGPARPRGGRCGAGAGGGRGGGGGPGSSPGVLQGKATLPGAAPPARLIPGALHRWHRPPENRGCGRRAASGAPAAPGGQGRPHRSEEHGAGGPDRRSAAGCCPVCARCVSAGDPGAVPGPAAPGPCGGVPSTTPRGRAAVPDPRSTTPPPVGGSLPRRHFAWEPLHACPRSLHSPARGGGVPRAQPLLRLSTVKVVEGWGGPARPSHEEHPRGSAAAPVQAC